MNQTTMDRTLSKEQIAKILPMKPPYLFIDSLRSFKEGEKQRVTGYYHLADNDMLAFAHDPENGIFPAALQIEMLSQCSYFFGAYAEAYTYVRSFGVTCKLDQARFYSMVKPTADLRAELELEFFRDNVGKYKAELYVNDLLVCKATITSYIKVEV